MITFERQQNILRLLSSRPGIKSSELAELLGVSRGTIRNDLLALEKEQKLVRVHGGARLAGNGVTTAAAEGQAGVDDTENLEGKRRIARWAAELVEHGDAILLDAGTTVQQMIPYLKEKRDLTVVTNGLETARQVKLQTNHAVIVLGGVLLDSGQATGGLLDSELLRQLNVHTAFLSGSGFATDTRLTERTLEEAELKKKIVTRSLQTVILMDSSKLGRTGRFPFASVEEVSHFYTDGGVTAEFIRQMRAANVTLMVCGENTFRSYTVSDGQPQYTLGFANQSEELPFAVDVRRGLERAVADLKNIDLVIADNKLSGEEALRVADNLIARNVDLAIEYQIDYTVGGLIMDKFQQAGIPVIAVDIPMVGATFFGIDNYRAGHVAGVAIGRWLGDKWDAVVDKVLVLEEPRAGTLPAARIQGQLDGLQEVLGILPGDRLLFLDSGNRRSISEARVCEALSSMPEAGRIAVLSFNTDAAMGALLAARSLGREEDVVIVGQGADRLLLDEIRQPDSRVIGSTTYMPERYGGQLIELALQILRREPVPPAVYTEHVFIDRENIDLYYPAKDSS
jgi:ribose transport system substrate-binding protein